MINKLYIDIIYSTQTHPAMKLSSFIVTWILLLIPLIQSHTGVTNDGTAIDMQNGISYFDGTDIHQWKYYKYTATESGIDMSIVLTVISGDADLYVSNTTQQPNIDDAIWHSAGWGSDSVDIENVSAGTYYIGVTAFTNSTWSLMTFLTQESTNDINVPCGINTCSTLTNGYPINQKLHRKHYKYYIISIFNPTDSLTISCGARVGDPDIMLNKGSNKPTRESYTWSSTSVGTDVITIPHPEVGDYTLAVYSYSSTDYTIVYKTSDITMTLIESTPFREDLQAGLYEYFMFSVNSINTGKDLTISLSLLTGDADIFASTINHHPTSEPDQHEYSGSSYGPDSITIPGSELKITMYYIAVKAFTTCTYTIVVTLDAPLQLHDGIPQSDSIVKEQMKYYRLNVKQWRSDANIMVTPFSGSIELYISNTTDPIRGNTDTYNYSSTQPYSLQSISITHNDIRAMHCHDYTCTLYIGVYGLSISDYTVLASSTNSSTTLQEGKPATGNVLEHSYRYYQFSNADPNSAVVFTLTTASGDGDLFASICPSTSTSTTPCNDHPTVSTHTWSSRRVGEDVILIDRSDDNYALGVYYIGIYGYSAAAYTLTASLMSTNHDQSTRTTLVDGLNSLGYADTDESKLYTFHIAQSIDNQQTQLTITATPKSGDIDLFVLRDTHTVPAVIPSADLYDWKSTQWGRDSIVINDVCSSSSGCDYIIACKAYSKSLFTVSATLHTSMTQLISGVSHRDTVEGRTYRYYYFVVDRSDSELVISVTAVSGDPDLYVSTNEANQHPTSDTYDYHSLNYGTDIVTINNPSIGNVYIGVYGFRNSTYQLSATLGSIALVSSEPHSDILQSDSYRIYTFDYSDGDAVGRTLTYEVDTLSNRGRFDLYICQDDEINVQCNTITQIKSMGQWNYIYDTDSTQQWNQDTQVTISITHTDTHRCTGTCTYKIAVIAHTHLSYSILATYGTVPVLLSEGRSVTQTINHGDILLYRFSVDSYSKAISIDCSEALGDVQLLADIQQHDTADQYYWKSPDNSATTGNHIGISSDDQHLQSINTDRTLYIAIMGTALMSRFTLSATTQNRLLVAGQPLLGSTSWGDSGDFYAMYVDMEVDKPQDVTIKIEHANRNVLHERAIFDIYIHTNATATTEPDSTTYIWHKQIGYDESLIIHKDDTSLCTSCTYYIGIFNTQINTKYLITGSTADSLDILYDYTVHQGTLDSITSSKYYETYVAQSGLLDITLETCTGAVDLYVSTKTREPRSGNAQYESLNTDDIDHIRVDESISDQSFYIGVHTSAQYNSSYTISTKTTNCTCTLNTAPVIDNRNLVIHNIGDGSVELIFAHASSASDGTDPNSALQYSIHSVIQNENDQHAVMYSMCGLQYVTKHNTYMYNELVDKLGSDNNIHIIIDNLDSSKYYDFNLLVIDTNSTDLLHNYAVYKYVSSIQPYDPNSITQSAIRYLLYVGIPVSVVVICTMIYLCISNRRLANELAIELNDVSASAQRKEMRSSLLNTSSSYQPPGSTRTGPMTTQDRYNVLIDEQDDEIESDDDGTV